MVQKQSRDGITFPCLKSILVIFLSAFIVGSCFSQTRTLGDYYTSARRYNATFVDYQNQLASLGYDSSKISSTFLPKVNFISQAMLAPVIGGIGYDSSISNGGVYSALISASQYLFQGGNRDLQLAKLGIQRQSLGTTLVINERDLYKGITTQYVTAYSDLITIQSAEESLKILDEQLAIVKELVKNAVYSQLDFLNLVIARNQQQIALLQAQTQYTTDLFKLNQLSGITDTSYIILPEPQLNPNPTASLPQSLRARQFTLDSLSIEYDRSLLDWTYKPKLGWFADAGLNTTDLRNTYHNLGFSVGLNFTIPIYDGGQRNFEYEKFNLAQSTIAAKSRAFFIETNIGRMMLGEQLRAQDSLVGEYRKQIESIGELLQYQKQMLRQGTVKITDLLLTLNTLNATRLSLRQAEVSRLQTIIELNYLNQ